MSVTEKTKIKAMTKEIAQFVERIGHLRAYLAGMEQDLASDRKRCELMSYERAIHAAMVQVLVDFKHYESKDDFL